MSAMSSISYSKEKPGYKMIRRYMMGDVLGEGSQGKVREALDSETLRRVAIKIINLRQLRKVRNAEEGLRRELAIHRRLKHPHVVELIEHFTVDEKQKVYVVLERVSGGAVQGVANYVPKGVLPQHMSRRFLVQLLDGLAYCHSQGVVHRDIKPSNLLVSVDGHVRIADFGVAEELSRFDTSDECSRSRGSPAFQPPEVAAGQERFSGFKVDVWAAGVSLFLLATGSVPFEGLSLLHLFENIAAGAFDIPQSIAADAQLVSLIRGMLTVDQEKRFSVSDARSHPWLNASDEWTEADRELVSNAVSAAASQLASLQCGAPGLAAGTRPIGLLRGVARMYGETLLEGGGQPGGAGATVASASLPAAPAEPPVGTASCAGGCWSMPVPAAGCGANSSDGAAAAKGGGGGLASGGGAAAAGPGPPNRGTVRKGKASGSGDEFDDDDHGAKDCGVS